MPVLIPPTPLSSPSLGARAVARPTYASTASAMASTLNTLCGYTTLRHGVMHYQIAAGAEDVSDAGTFNDEPPPLRWRRTSAAAYVWAGLWLLAEQGKTLPVVELELQLADGTAVDDPIVWSLQNNFLPTAPTPRSSGGLVVFGESRDIFVHTGWETRPVVDLPRLLDLSAADAGDEVQLRITEATGVRIYALMFAEAYQEQLG